MTLLDTIIFALLKRRKSIIHKRLVNALDEQHKTFSYLLSLYDGNEYARVHNIDKNTPYDVFRKNIPIVTYEEFFPYIEKMLLGKKQIVKKPTVTTFAKSSGTTNAKSKYIPLTKNNLKHNHYQAGRDMIAWAVVEYNNTKFVHGKTIGTTGSFSSDPLYPSAHIGDVSAHLFHSLPWYARRTRVADNDIILHHFWQEKLTSLGEHAWDKDVRILLGTPTWMIQIFDEVLQQTGKKTIADVWPHVAIFFHGAVRLDPYKKILDEKIGKSIDYMNIYNASEGFFGFQYTKDKPNEFVLLTHYDIFYEFIEMSSYRAGHRDAIPLDDIKLGVEYALVITTSGGLVRYLVGDTIKFVSKNPYIFCLTGRTKQQINAFGEEVVLDNIEEALLFVCKEENVSVHSFTVASEVHANGTGKHVWAIEFVDKPKDLLVFSQKLDHRLQQINGDYEAKRSGDLVLKTLFIKEVPQGTFMTWLSRRGKMGGQHKVPHITDSLSMIQELEKISNE